MAITWKQIDTNGSGYVDGAEEAVAKARGVKNVWNYMTETDFLTNTTREQKLNSIKKYYYEFGGTVHQYACNSQERRAIKKQKEDDLLQLHNKYDKYVREHADELAELDNKKMNKFKYLYKSGVANLKEFFHNTSFDTDYLFFMHTKRGPFSAKERKELSEHDKASASYKAIKQQIWNMQEEMNHLLNVIEAL